MLAFSSMVGDAGYVYAFEPQPIISRKLCVNMAFNSIGNVSCQCVALSDETDDVLILNVIILILVVMVKLKSNNLNKVQKVPRKLLDETLSFKKLKLIKIDVEGMEANVIRGAKNIIQQHQPTILY